MVDDTPTTPTDQSQSDQSQVEQLTMPLGSLPIERLRVTLWAIMLVLVAALVYVGWRYVGTVVMGVFVYYVTRPVFRRIHARVESRTRAVVATLVVAALPLLLLVAWTLAILVDALSGLLGSTSFAELETLAQPYIDLSAFVGDLETTVRQGIADPTRLADIELGPALSDVLTLLGTWVGVVVTAGIHAFIVLIIVFYLLRDDYRIAQWGRNTFLTEDSVLDSYFRTVDNDLHNVYFGNILNALLTGLLAAVVYTLLNFVAPATTRIPEAAFLGLLVGAASLVPLIGIKIVTWPVGGYLLALALWQDPQAVWFPVLFLVVSFVVVDYIPDQVLRPYVSGRTLHVGAVMLAYTIGPLLFGWYGIFLAPLLFVIIFEFARIVFPWLLDPDRPAVAAPGVADAPAKSESAESPEETAPEDAAEATEPADDGSVDSGEDRRFPGPTEGQGSGDSN